MKGGLLLNLVCKYKTYLKLLNIKVYFSIYLNCVKTDIHVLFLFGRSDSAALDSRKNSINEAGLSGIRGLLSQGLTRAQHSAMDLRKSVMETGSREQSRRGSFQTSMRKDDRVEPKIYVNSSEDIGCMNDFVGIQGGEETSSSYPNPEYQQIQSNEGIQIVVQEHVDSGWDLEGRRASQVSDVHGFQNSNSSSIPPQSRRGM